MSTDAPKVREIDFWMPGGETDPTPSQQRARLQDYIRGCVEASGVAAIDIEAERLRDLLEGASPTVAELLVFAAAAHRPVRIGVICGARHIDGDEVAAALRVLADLATDRESVALLAILARLLDVGVDVYTEGEERVRKGRLKFARRW